MKTTKTKTQSLRASSYCAYCAYCGSHELSYDVHTAELDCVDCGWPAKNPRAGKSTPGTSKKYPPIEPHTQHVEM